jgi:hypothetical protein
VGGPRSMAGFAAGGRVLRLALELHPIVR